MGNEIEGRTMQEDVIIPLVMYSLMMFVAFVLMTIFGDDSHDKK